MGCSISLKGLPKDCKNSMGGVSKVWIAPYSANTATLNEGKVSIDTGKTEAFQAYYFKKNTANFTSTLNVDVANGVNYISTELNLTFNKMETEKRVEIATMSVGDMSVVVKDANGSYWFMGLQEPVTATAGTGNSGTAKTDGNSYQITLTDESTEWLYELDDDTAKAIEAIDYPTA